MSNYTAPSPADALRAADEMPRWLTDALGADAKNAHDAYDAEKAETKRLTAESRERIKAKNALRDRLRRLDPDVTEETVAEAERDLARWQRENGLGNGRRPAQARAALALHRAVYADRDRLRKVAAAVAAEAQQRAVEAHAALTEALARRDAAFRLAGSPGANRPGSTFERVVHNAFGERRRAEETLDKVVNVWPLAAVEEAAK